MKNYKEPINSMGYQLHSNPTCGTGHLKTRLLPDLKSLQNVPKHSLFKLCEFHEKIFFFSIGQNVLYNA